MPPLSASFPIDSEFVLNSLAFASARPSSPSMAAEPSLLKFSLSAMNLPPSRPENADTSLKISPSAVTQIALDEGSNDASCSFADPFIVEMGAKKKSSFDAMKPIPHYQAPFSIPPEPLGMAKSTLLPDPFHEEADMIAFLSDVDLESEDEEDDEDVAYRHEDELGRIYAMKHAHNNAMMVSNRLEL